MNETYSPHHIESQAQADWVAKGSFVVTPQSDKEPFYCLSMFPYPSGKLHMGHVRNYTLGDAIARFQRMLGKNVMQPMGWDAFGLPAENAAMKEKVAPAFWTYTNIDYMKTQFHRLGLAIDWSRELATCRPDYYRWEQWLFTRLFKEGLIYRKNGWVNWDPVEHSVLANEQVIDGRGWRSDALVEKREIPMYYFRITAYAQALLDDLDQLSGWPERVKTMQRNWIGRSEGALVHFPYDESRIGQKGHLTVYTTRPDTLMGVTYVAVASEHPLAKLAIDKNPELASFVDDCRSGSIAEADLATQEKKGMDTGLKVVHPISGDLISVWIANYVLWGYGEGAVMAVPAHDARDFAFAQQYNLTMAPLYQSPAHDVFDEQNWQDWYAQKHGLVYSLPGEWQGLSMEDVHQKTVALLEDKSLGERQVQFRLRDWGISRQRYWGCPIPIIHCDACGDVPVPDEQLPVILPEDVVPDGCGSPLAKLARFYECQCPQCGQPARRETDTMDTFVESSWYYARYTSPHDDRVMLNTKEANHWLPVNQYIGGIEHAVLHLLYARFFHKLLRDQGLVDSDEPFVNLLTQGMVVAETFYRLNANGSREWISPQDVVVERDDKGKVIQAKHVHDDEPVICGGVEKMSKSKNNGIEPTVLLDQYGADTCRLFMLFAAPPDLNLEWSDTGFEGASRFLKRIWRFTRTHLSSGSVGSYTLDELTAEQIDIRAAIHRCLAQATQDMPLHKFNTVIAAAMTLLNVLEKVDATLDTNRALIREGLQTLLLILSPMVPHVTHALWLELGHERWIIDEPWPLVDETALIRKEVEIVLQVNGKMRGKMIMPTNITGESLEEHARAHPMVLKHTQGMSIRKVVVVPGKVVNIVAN